MAGPAEGVADPGRKPITGRRRQPGWPLNSFRILSGTPEEYVRYLAERRPDVAMLSHDMARMFRERGLLAPLPEDVSRALRGPDYASFIPGSDADGLLSYTAPLHFGVWGALWNRELTGDDLGPTLCDVSPVRFCRTRGGGCRTREPRRVPRVRFASHVPGGRASGVPGAGSPTLGCSRRWPGGWPRRLRACSGPSPMILPSPRCS